MEKTKEEILYELLVEKSYAQVGISISDAMDKLLVDSSRRDVIFQDKAILTGLLNGASIVEKIVIQEIISLRERIAQVEEVVDKRWYQKCQELFVNVQEQEREIVSLRSRLRGTMQISDEQLQKIGEVLEMSVPDCLDKFVPYPDNYNVRIAHRFGDTTVRELLRYRNKKQLIVPHFGKLSATALENMLKCVSGATGFEFKLGMDLSFLD